jgi:catechol 2,3-dioxygenase-like lactoylglutathione lyase family enzyme
MRIGKLFHLTPLVDSLADAEFFFNSLFSPLCMMRNYSSHWHRHAAIFVIANASIEPMHVLPPEDDGPATSWYRYMEKHGPHVHNIAFYVDDIHALEQRLSDAGVRTTDGGAGGGTVFAHPKDTPGMLEFTQPDEPFGWHRNDPRFTPSWRDFSREFWTNGHALGLERLSHLTVVVHDVDAARRFYTDVLDAEPLPEQGERAAPDAESTFVLVGEDTVLELAQPRDDSSVLGRELADVGQCVTGVTFKVVDAAQAAQHLTLRQAPVATTGDHEITLDRTRTWNTDYRFTDLSLVGDPREL